jgi:hypothetical protein
MKNSSKAKASRMRDYDAHSPMFVNRNFNE